ncbi:MAG: hypothetical protein AVO38_09645 [delta proteobacterium ML8_D]|nr:MAG: hypothetical protein AVO38_09645 [delta proteobacterium ML8_D]
MRETSKMKRCRWKSVTISLFLSVLGFILLLPVLVEAHPKDFTFLIEDPADSSPSGDRTPLVLIHGIHGNQWPTDVDDVNNPFLYYWQTFRMFFYSWDKSGLKDKYKLYSFWYESDQISVDEISQGLRDWIDERSFQEPGTPDKLDDRPFVIVAHSMGGLVARAFMNQTLNIGQWPGHSGGERVIKLVTLGTPHHGSPGANDEDALAAYYASGVWDQIFSLSQFFYNVTSAAWASKWDVTFHSTQPNRSDLRWDGKLWPSLPFDDKGILMII